MNTEDIYAGQHVRIRDFDDLVAEYSPGFSPQIRSYFICDQGVAFHRDMVGLCGTELVVKNLEQEWSITVVRFYDEHALKRPDSAEYWTITPGMIEPVQEDPIEDVPLSELMSILS